MPAQPITPPYPIDKSSAVNIDFNGDEYLLRWDGDCRETPDLTYFPHVDNATVTLIPQSERVKVSWATSQVLAYGADSHIRILDSCGDKFSVCKVAINDRQRQLLQGEFSILQHLSSKDLPVVRIHQEPLADEQGIFGFRMERLSNIDIGVAAEYIPEVAKAFEEVHLTGVVHYDISPSNIMLNQKGKVTIIDFGRAGYIGQEVPSIKAVGKPKEKEIYSVESDNVSLERVNGMYPLHILPF
jgi:serine/threonine protein kinase